MRIIKMFFILLLVVTVIGAGAYYVSLHSKNTVIAAQLSRFPALQQLLPTLLSSQAQGNIQAGAQNLSQKLPSVGQVSQIGNVLGVSSAKNAVQAGGESLPQRAFAAARYTYCQQVVEDYEKRQDE